MQSPFQTAPLVKHATDIMRGEFVKELVDTPISAVSVSKVILCPNATGIKQQTDQMTMGHPEKILKPQLIYNDLQLPPPKLNKCKLPTPIKTDILKFYLQGYDSEKSLYLLNGFKYGFRLEHNGPRSQFNCSNLKSAKSNPLIVQEKINKEPSVIILQIGGNDLCDPGLKPETLACKIVDLMSDFQLHYSFVNKIVVCELLRGLNLGTLQQSSMRTREG
ncbi:unnamed protein product [Mytilus coruscus]|uniref:Uncharacterized protein n=1 Tax=Mytilus coruscus TaxID=42192 RepID=A0A6J8B490_MYTCO|nr:unnamed protein product [Mytilus coruscus]